nr:hypothetical protein BaRGS_017142 [Batillaria attramentaria]
MGEEQYSINTGVVRKFGTVDYVLFVCTLVVSAGIGVFYAIQDRRRNTTKEFLLGGKKMNIFPVAMSLMGGMKAVLWTDTFQAGVIFAGLLAVVIKGSLIQGGFVNAWEIANNRSRVLLDDFDPKTRHSVWSMVIGGTVFWLYLYGGAILRKAGSPSRALLVNLPGLILINIICFMIGIVMFAFYADCHPITYGVISKTDQLVPLYAMDILGHLDGMVGIFVSCVVSGSLSFKPFVIRLTNSSLSSSLNAISAIIFRDYIQGMNLCQNISELRSTITSKLVVTRTTATIFIIVIVIVIVIVVVIIVVVIIIIIVVVVIVFIIAVVVVVIIIIIIQDRCFVKPTSLDPRLVLPIFDKLFPYLPERILKPLRFGVIHEGKYDLPPAKSSQSINISMHTESQDSVTMETTLEDKQPDDVILSNGYVKPSFALDDKDAGTERANGLAYIPVD